MKEVVEKFCPDRYYGWNYLNLIGPKGTIEFRRGPVSTRKKTVLFWTHAVRLFIKAAIYNYPDFRALLQQYPEDIGGLRKYLSSTESLPTIVASHLDTFNDNEKREPTLELSMPRV